jgi:hypothetical protein
MPETVLIGRGRAISTIHREEWEEGLSFAPEAIGRRLQFMSPIHHRVRNFVVSELPRMGRPIPLVEIADTLHLPRDRTKRVVEDLERHLFFLVRGDKTEVSWAFPVTAGDTGHHLVFSTGERLDAA